jgi:hypothetical protein
MVAFYLIPIIGMVSFTNINAQILTSSESINALNKGVLVIRLDMQQNKIEAYKASISSGNLSEKDLIKMEENLQEIKTERKKYKEAVKEAFSEHYNYSKLVFIENQNFKAFLDGTKVKIEGEDDAIDLINKTENLFYLIKGRNDGHWIIVNEDFKRPPSPFPSSFSLSGFTNFFDLLIGKKSYSLANQIKLAKKINKKLYSLDSKL